MKVHVRALIFSGRPDPEWELTEAEAKALVAAISLSESSEPRSNTEMGTPVEPGLGYRGFSIIAETDDGIRTVSVFRGALRTHSLDRAVPAPPIGDVPMETYLLETLRQKPQRGWVEQHMTHRSVLDAIARDCNISIPHEVPAGDTADDPVWNQLKVFNNCYSYALDLPEYDSSGKRNPGYKTFSLCSGGAPRYTCCPSENSRRVTIAAALDADGVRDLHPAKLPRPPAGAGFHNIAAFVASDGYDFHFYRQHDSGYWSHKPGAGKVRHLQVGGCRIVDPRVDFFAVEQQPPVGEFCGFFQVQKNALDLC
jgi:hypothetical protein